MHQNQSTVETVLEEVQNFLDTLRQLIVALNLAPDFTYRLDAYENELNQIQNKCENAKNIVAEIPELFEIVQEEFKQVIKEAEELKLKIEQQIQSIEQIQPEILPTVWEDIQPDTVYQTKPGILVSFSKKQIFFAKTKDREGNHLKAIDKGEVPPQGHQGLIRSEEPGFELKSKVLGKGVSHYRFHGKMINGILHFPGKITNKK